MGGFWRALFLGEPSLAEVASASAPRFAIDEDSIPAQIFGLESYSDPVAPVARVDRKAAMSVPAIKRARDLICGSLGGLPLDLIGPDKRPVNRQLFDQPERNVPRSVTMTRTLEDLLLEGVAWWRITGFDYRGYPSEVVRLDPRSVNVRKDRRVFVRRDGQSQGQAEEWVPDEQLIRFDSPNDALLVAGARAIRTCLQLDAAAANAATGVPPVDYFTPNEGADPAEDEEITDLLSAWKTARQTGRTAYIPQSLKYNIAGWNPEQLQMAEQRQHAVLEIARLAGVDPEELGVSTTSRTYSNQFDRRKSFVDFTLGGYRQAVEDRLSMVDVTPRGYRAKFNLSAFLRSDDKTRFETYEIGKRVGAITNDEIRDLEDKPELTPAEAESVTPQEAPVAASDIEYSFDTVPEIRLDASGAQTFEVDAEKRTIRGLAVPYGSPAASNGQKWQFSQGSLKWADVSRVKLWVQHDAKQAVGVATHLDDRPDGLFATFKVARGSEGDKALSLAEDGVLDGLSVGLGRGGRFSRKGDVNHAVEAPLMEVSLTPAPSFDDARVHAVAASATQGEVMDEVNETVEVKDEAPDFSSVADAIKAGFEAMADKHAKEGGREVISAGAPLEVNEPPLYRFDGLQGEHDFSTDLIAFGRDRDSEAGERVTKFLEDAFSPKFDVDTANVSTLNPSRNRPDMYVDERKKTTPFYSALYSGSLQDSTPFVVPKFNSASGLVADHVEGTEPTAGSFTATSQTVTPSAVSGKVEITREVWDQGGSPQVSGLIWNKMQYAYYQALEAKAVALLNAASPTGITLTAGAADDALVGELEAALADLNFVAGGNVFNFAGTQIDLYKKLAAAVDGNGRPLLPQIGPSNANGQSQRGFRAIDVAGTLFLPAWSLAATGAVAASSYLVDTDSVHVWNTPPKRLEFEYRVAYIDLAIWGYVAAAITDLTGVRELIYDPVA